MALSNEKIAEIQTLAHLLGVEVSPDPEQINGIYEGYLARLNAPSPRDPKADAENARIAERRLQEFRKANGR